MDCVISGPSAVKLFCSSISCLSKIGKDLYVEHDVASGVVLRALNDSKSAYCSMRFAPSYFERCRGGGATTTSNGSQYQQQQQQQQQQGNSKRSRSSSRSSPRSSSSSPTTTTAAPHPSSSPPASTQPHDGVSVRMAMRAMAPVVKPRKDVRQLRITSWLDESPARLAFEFLILKRPASSSSSGDDAGTLIRVVHCIPASDADAVSAVVDSTILPSELVCPPRALLRLLEPLSRFKDVTEVALVVQRRSKVLAAQSFHHTDRYRVVVPAQPRQQQQQQANPDVDVVPVWEWVERGQDASRVVKTEASMSLEEVDEFVFQDDRMVRGDNDDDEEEGDGLDILDDAPDHVNDGVVLVFPVREARAFLQFGSSFVGSSAATNASSATGWGNSSTEPMPWRLDSTRVQFHWGGRPVVMELSTAIGGENSSDRRCWGGGGLSDTLSSPRGRPAPFSARLVLASLDHKLLTDSSTTTTSIRDDDNN